MEDWFWVEVGDRVKINSDYWNESNGKFVYPYGRNGPDHIYTVTEILDENDDGYYLIALDGHSSDGWTNRLCFLTPVATGDFDISDDMSIIFG